MFETSPDGEAGFTLVEMLVSLALLGMAAVLVTQGMGSDRAALRRVERHVAGGEQVQAAQDLVRNRLEHLFAQTRYDGLASFADIDGDDRQIDFLSAAPTPDQGVQVHRFHLCLDGAGELKLLSNAAGEGGACGGEASDVLLHGVQAIQLAYWGPDGADPQPGWRAQWSRQNAPPKLVRIRLSFPSGDRRTWPELIARPAVTVDSDCIYDRVAGACRGNS